MEKKQTYFFLITGSRYPGIHGRSNTKQTSTTIEPNTATKQTRTTIEPNNSTKRTVQRTCLSNNNGILFSKPIAGDKLYIELARSS